MIEYKGLYKKFGVGKMDNSSNIVFTPTQSGSNDQFRNL